MQFCESLFEIATGYSDAVIAVCTLRREDNLRHANNLAPDCKDVSELNELCRGLYDKYTVGDFANACRPEHRPAGQAWTTYSYESPYPTGVTLHNLTAVALVHTMMAATGGHSLTVGTVVRLAGEAAFGVVERRHNGGYAVKLYCAGAAPRIVRAERSAISRVNGLPAGTKVQCGDGRRGTSTRLRLDFRTGNAYFTVLCCSSLARRAP